MNKSYDELTEELSSKRDEAVAAINALEKTCEEICESRQFSEEYRKLCSDGVVVATRARLSVRQIGKW